LPNSGGAERSLRLGPEGLQLLDVLRLQVLLRLDPLHGSVKAVLRPGRVAELRVTQGEKEQVKGVPFPLARGEAFFQRDPGRGILPVAILHDAQGVEKRRVIRASLDRLGDQLQSPCRVARSLARDQMPRLVVEEGWIIRAQLQRLFTVRFREVSL